VEEIIVYVKQTTLGLRDNNNNNNDDNREKAFLYQRLSVMIQRYNAVAILAHFPTQPLRTNSSRSSLSVFKK